MAFTPIPTQATNPTPATSALPVRGTPATSWRNGFSAVTSGVDSTYCSVVATGSGMTVNQSAGALVVTTGTTVNSETIIRANPTWSNNFLLRYQATLSQRIANQTFYVEMVDVIGDGLATTINSATSVTVTIPSNPFTSQNVGQSMYLGAYSGTGTFVPGRYAIASISGNDVTFTVSGFATGSGTVSAFGWNYYQVQYTSTTATSTNFDTQRKGWNGGFTAATITSTASPGHIGQIFTDDSAATYSDSATTSQAVMSMRQRASRFLNIPSVDVPLRLQIRAVNGSTAPGSTTTLSLSMVSVEEISTLPVSIVNGKQVGQGAGVQVGSQANTPIYVQDTVTYPTTAAAAADSTTNPSISHIGADGMLFNGTSWDRFRNNINATTGDTGAKTATFNGTTNQNWNHAGGLIVTIVSAVSGTTPTLTTQLQWSPDGGTTFFNYGPATTGLTTSAGQIGIFVYPTQFEIATSTTLAALTTGLTNTLMINAPLPRHWRLVYTIGGTSPSYTLTNTYVNYIL